MKDIYNQTLEDFLSITASDSPTPGGGSVAAITGVLGVALVQMVGNLTLGKEKYRDVEEEIKQLVSKGTDLMERLKKLARDDMDHFDTFVDVLSMPKETPEQIETRKDRLQKALKDATGTPLAIADAGVEVLALACRMAEVGTKNAVSDTGVAAHLAEAAVQSALITAQSNIPRIQDQDFVDWAQKEQERLSREALMLKEKTLDFMRPRMA